MQTPSNKTGSGLAAGGGLLVILAALAALTALAGGAAAAADTGLEEIGVVHADTLFVDRELVIKAALRHNEMLAASGEMRAAADADALGAWRGFLPRVSLGAYRLRTDDALYGFGFKLNQRRATMADFAAPPAGNTLNEPGVGENNIMQVRLQQPVFNAGMALYGKKAADAMAGAARHEHARAAETVRFHAVQAYEGLVLAKAYEGVILAALASSDGHVERSQAMVDNEMVTEADLLQAKVHRDGLRQRLIEVRNLAATAGDHIRMLTAVSTSLPLAPAGDRAGAATDAAIGAISAADRGDVAGRADVLAAREQAAAAAHMAKVARGAMLPHLNLQAEKNWFHRDELFGDEADSWTFGVYATWDVFSGLEDVGALRKARAQSRAAAHLADSAQRQAGLELDQARREAAAAAEKLGVAADAVVSARESLRIVDEMYREGLASMVDLLDVQAMATQAEGALVQARHDLRVSEAGMIYAGAIDPAAGREDRE
ncbi:MAG: TolC family protein [Candidatus Latescibacteria bacterium]|nr:TolC family protein [Candidatus Latescibacterota bacterium]